MLDQEIPVLLLVITAVLTTALVALFFAAGSLHLSAQHWATRFRLRPGGSIAIVGIGTLGAREAVRIVTAFAAAKATNEVAAVVLADFHQEVFGYAATLRRMLGSERVITPSNIPPGAGQGFMHRMEHDRRTQDDWVPELEDMVHSLRTLNSGRGSTLTTVFYVLPSWSGHFPIAVRLAKMLKEVFREPILHVGHLNLPSRGEADLRHNRYTRPDFPGCLGLDGILVSDEQLDPAREIHDWTIAAGLAGLFAANRIDPGQQHGANPFHSLIEFAKPSRGLIGLGVGQGSTILVRTLFRLRRDLAEQDLSIDVSNVIPQALGRKAWEAPHPDADAPSFVSIVVPLDKAHSEWLNGGLRSDAIKDLPEGRLPDGCTAIWTAANIKSGTRKTAANTKKRTERTAQIYVLWLYPVTDPTVVITPEHLRAVRENPKAEAEGVQGVAAVELEAA